MERQQEETKGAMGPAEAPTLNLTSAYIQSRNYEQVLDKKHFKELQVNQRLKSRVLQTAC